MKRIDEVFIEALEDIEGRYNGTIKSMLLPWDSFNKAGINGWEWGTINTIAAMSGMGKTAMANQIISEVQGLNPTQEIVILVFTMEMAAKKLIGRTISLNMKRSVQDIYTKATAAELEFIKNKIMPKYISKEIYYEELQQTPMATRHTIDRFAKTHKGKKLLVIYDHTTLVKREESSSERDSIIQLYAHFNDLKKIYPESLYIILSQMNRELEEPFRIAKPALHFPKKGDLFGSDAPYQFADVFIALHDPFNMGIMNYGPSGWNTKGFIFAHLLKVREGQPNRVVIFHNNLKNNQLIELTPTELVNYGFRK